MSTEDLSKLYESYKTDKSKYEKELYLKESKEKEIREKILSDLSELNKLGFKGLTIDVEKLNDREYLLELLESVKSKLNYISDETEELLKSR